MKPDFQKQALIRVIVQDEKTNAVLMLAYANEEAYEKMLKTNETWFYSRSRQELWHKGETSGHFQKIKGMYLDCDADSLLVFVEQIGVACHTGAPSCFFNTLKAFDSRDIFRDLEDLIETRKKNPVEKSYTNYLLNEGIDKVLKKVGEEASEVIIASKNPSKEDLIGEIDDLLYHLFVLMSIYGVSLDEIEAKLKARHQISGNKKEFHTRGEM